MECNMCIHRTKHASCHNEFCSVFVYGGGSNTWCDIYVLARVSNRKIVFHILVFSVVWVLFKSKVEWSWRSRRSWKTQ